MNYLQLPDNEIHIYPSVIQTLTSIWVPLSGDYAYHISLANVGTSINTLNSNRKPAYNLNSPRNSARLIVKPHHSVENSISIILRFRYKGGRIIPNSRLTSSIVTQTTSQRTNKQTDTIKSAHTDNAFI